MALTLVGCATQEDPTTAPEDASTAPDRVAGAPGADGAAFDDDQVDLLVGFLAGSPCRLAEPVGLPDRLPVDDADTALVDPVVDGLPPDLVLGRDRGPFVAVAVDVDDDSDATVLTALGLDEVLRAGEHLPVTPFRGGSWLVGADPARPVFEIDRGPGLVSAFPSVAVETTSDGTTPLRDALCASSMCGAFARQIYDRPPPASEVRPDRMTVEPAEARPGEEVELFFPDETIHGIAFRLDRADGDGWDPVAGMNSDADGATYQQTGDVGLGHIDIAVGGPGPDRVVLPDDLEAGAYRICTANAGDDFCAALTVTE